jgi:hypothetical protein
LGECDAAVDSNYANAYYNWGCALKDLGKDSEAEEKFAKYRELSGAG